MAARPVKSSKAPGASSAGLQPLIAEKYIDVPSQRLYVLSIGLLCQAIKVFEWIQCLFSSDLPANWALKWMAVDALYFLTLKQLRISRLNYSKAAVLLQIITFWFLDGIMFGGIQVGFTQYSLISGVQNMYRRELSTTGRMVSLRDIVAGDEHLKGEHTVKMSPISTAKLNSKGQAFCLSGSSSVVLIPVLLNNTYPTHIRYSLSALDSSKIDFMDLSMKDIKAIEQSRVDQLQLNKISSSTDPDEEEDDWDSEDHEDSNSNGDVDGDTSSHYPHLDETQSVAHIKISKPGRVRLERAFDASTSNDARIFPNDVLVVPCPEAEFVEDDITRGNDVRCVGAVEQLSIKVSGVPPLNLKWHKEINGRREHFLVEGIEGSHDKERQTQDLYLPLSLSLNLAGTHQYILDGLSDAAGNSVSLAQNPSMRNPLSHDHSTTNAYVNPKTIRSLNVLRRPSMSFRDCSPGQPASLLIGAEAALLISSSDADPQDGPWNVTLKYQPLAASKASEQKHATWKRTFTTQAGKKALTVNVNEPGEYAIIDVKGTFCPGDVLSPESCRVVEQLYPTADIEWRRIHECSGDTGVSASLVLRGKPPFQVYFRQQRNDEPAEEMVRTFRGSRGEITLQPESSGNYTYTFVYLGDANYRRITLDGPSINQVVHPPAFANFVLHGTSGAGGKRSMNSCSGRFVEADVEMRGKGPWNLEVQIVGPMGSQILHISDLERSTEKLRLPLPQAIDQEGGMFQIDLVSVKDSYGCKKNLAVPGLSVNVRRVKPTVKFFAKDGKRATTVLEKQEARLPLRLMGDGPWKVRYRRTEPSGPATTVVLQNPNDYLRVSENGVYELLEVSDSQCPGSVDGNAADFRVDWIPRPTARLWPETEVTYEPFNGSHIRPPVCEGRDDHVDLELTGQPPFQIMYNVARDSRSGGTKILDQPVISSIQQRTRFQLHTSEAGRIYYEVKQIGDSVYPLAQNKLRAIPRMERLLFEQEVLARPAAYFGSSLRMSHCLNDPFIPRDDVSMEGMVSLEGTPPFLLELSVKNLAASDSHRETIELWDMQWRVDLAHYRFKSIGPHLVTIESVRDASHCEQAIPDPLKRSIWVDVAESAAIVPFDRREHFCVGDVTQFQLEGTPPWTIGFNSNRKYHEQIAKVSPLALVQQHPGNFSVMSISHQHKSCKTTVDNINFQVHALPSAQVAHGRDHFENIHEGSQAQIIFTLIGEPPFTFTYQRSEPLAYKGARPGKILETHTVSGVTSHEYSIYSALEGTWSVTFISDKYCRYPPAEASGAAYKTKA